MAEKCIMVGYLDEQKGYKCYNVIGNRFVALSSTTTETSDYAQKNRNQRESPQDVNVENPNMGKTKGKFDLQKKCMVHSIADEMKQMSFG